MHKNSADSPYMLWHYIPNERTITMLSCFYYCLYVSVLVRYIQRTGCFDRLHAHISIIEARLPAPSYPQANNCRQALRADALLRELHHLVHASDPCLAASPDENSVVQSDHIAATPHAA